MSDRVKVIASTTLSRRLVKDGFRIVDLKPHKNDSKRTVHVFEYTKELEEYLISNNLEV